MEPTRREIEIIPRKRMPSDTMCFLAIRMTDRTTTDVLLTRHRLKMVRTHTRTITTEMIEFHAVRDRADKVLINGTMLHHKAPVQANLEVTTCTRRAFALDARFHWFTSLANTPSYMRANSGYFAMIWFAAPASHALRSAFCVDVICADSFPPARCCAEVSAWLRKYR